MLEYKGKNYACHIDLGLGLLRGKWKALILCNLDGNPMRYSSLHKKIGLVSHKVFNEQLKELELDGLIQRTVFDEVPIKVEFCLTENGKTLIPALRIFEKWVKENFEDMINNSCEEEQCK